MRSDPLLAYIQQDLAHDLMNAAANIAVTMSVLNAGHAMAIAAGDTAADELHEAIEHMQRVHDDLHEHAARLAAATLP